MKSNTGSMRDIILKYVLKNALDFNGKANPKVVLGLVLKENQELRRNVPTVVAEIDLVVNEVGAMTLADIKKKLQKIAPELLVEEKKETIEGPLKALPNAVMGKVVVRIAPSPSGPLHIGHAYGSSLNYEYAKMYKGKLILRIEDTNAENIYQPAYEMIEQDAQWLTDNGVSEVVVQSSRLGVYYDYTEKLVQMGKAYVCTCDAEEWKLMKNQGTACPCRELSVKENSSRWQKMFGEYAEGEAVVRLKTDITHKNPAMRDFGIVRIVEHVHPKTGKEYRVWPLMVFSVAIDDHDLGVTHVLNGKDHADNATKEKVIMDCFSWKHPEYKHWGRINFEGFELSTTKTKQAIAQGEYKGWDDPRLPFLPALRKRGYQPGAFRKFAVEIGLSLNDKTVTQEEFWKMINAFNKEIIEPKANRYFFIEDPTEVVIENTPSKKVELELHPDFPARGKRELAITGKFLLSQQDVEKLEEGKIHRLMDCLNFERKGKKYFFHSAQYDEYKNASNRGLIIHWLPAGDANEVVDVIIITMDGTIKGKGEKVLRKVKIGQIIQLERRYFARVEEVTKKMITVWQLHK